MADVEWKGDEFLSDLVPAVYEGLESAGYIVQSKVRRRLNRAGTPTSKSGRKRLRQGMKLLQQIRGVEFYTKAQRRRLANGKKVKGKFAGTALSEAARLGVIGPNAKKARRKAFREAVSYQRLFEETGGRLVDPPGGSPRLRTGFLLRGLRQQLGNDDQGQYVQIGIGAEVPYALIHELGGPIIRKGRKVGQMPERPYLRPSLAEARTEALQAMSDTINERMAAKGWLT